MTRPDLAPHAATLVQLTRTAPDPRVRHRADALVLVADGVTLTATAALLPTSDSRVRAWRDRSLAEGRDGLADRPRPGWPGKLDAAADQTLADRLTRSPLDEGYPVTTWIVADLTDALARRGWPVSTATVHRALRRLGYRSRRPRHDLTHQQDPEAVASARHALAELQKRGLLPMPASGSSTSMNANSTPIPTWRRSGTRVGHR